MKRYKCHKEVEAAKITKIVVLHSAYALYIEGGVVEVPDDDKWDQAKIGGYYVKYQDGYESYSPAEPFETGYTEI